MNDFTFYSPTFFSFGKDSENETGTYVKRFGGHKVLIHYGGGSVVRSGLLDRVKASLDKEGIPYVLLGGVQPNPRSGLVYEGIELCKKENVDFVLAVGGGSSIDSAKAIAAGVVYDGDFWDFYCGKAIENALPVGTILTISAAGSEGSPDSVITYEDGMFKRGASGDAIRPKFSILNPALTQTLPAYQTACGITDIMAHYGFKPEQIKSVEILNPIELGKSVEAKDFILDIRVLLNDDTVVNLEMQVLNLGNWPERSLGYLCRSFDSLSRGQDYIETKSVIQVCFLDFTLFPETPEFFGTYMVTVHSSATGRKSACSHAAFSAWADEGSAGL